MTPVFTPPDGGQLRHGNFYNRTFQPTVQKTLPGELQRARFHDLRHTHAALLIAQGAHPKAIQYRLGHSSITVTLDRYGHLFPALDDALTDALDATYAGPTRSTTSRDHRSTPSDPPKPRARAVVCCGLRPVHRNGADDPNRSDLRKHQSRERDSNSRPSLYKSAALTD